MSEQDVTPEAATEDVQAATEDAAPDSLGDPGKKALQAERAARKAEHDARVKAERALADALEAQNKTAEERAAMQQQRELEQAALAKANERILAAEIRAVAKGELADPSDALTFIDRSKFEVGEDGSVDAEAIQSAIAELLETKPYLAARRETPRVQGSADSGTREVSGPRQWTRAELRGKSPQQIDEAREAGLLDDVLSGKS